MLQVTLKLSTHSSSLSEVNELTSRHLFIDLGVFRKACLVLILEVGVESLLRLHDGPRHHSAGFIKELLKVHVSLPVVLGWRHVEAVVPPAKAGVHVHVLVVGKLRAAPALSRASRVVEPVVGGGCSYPSLLFSRLSETCCMGVTSR